MDGVYKLNLRALFSLILLIICSISAQSQDLEGEEEDTIITAIVVDVSPLLEKVKLNYESANYNRAIEYLDSAIIKLNNTSIEIQYWLAKSNFSLSRFKQARVDAVKYLEFPDANVHLGFLEITQLKADIDAKIGVEDTVIRDVSNLVGGGFTESETWDFARKTGNLQAYRNYIKFYPDGPHLAEAKSIVEYQEKLTQEPSKLLAEAVKRGDMKLVRDLLDRGADVNFAENYTRVFERAEGKLYEINFEMPLYAAVMKMDYAMTKFLLENGADPNRFVYRKVYTYQSGGKSKTILESLIIATSQNGRYPNHDDQLIELIDLLLKHGLDINFYNGSPLCTAVYYHDAKKYRRTKLIRYLLRKGADPKLRGWNDGERSALDIAKDSEDKRMIQTLKEKRYRDIRKTLAKKQLDKLKQYRKEQIELEKQAKEKAKQEKLLEKQNESTTPPNTIQP
jgi:hypothetical protein